MQAGIPNQEKFVSKDRKTILREEKMKKKKKKEREGKIEVRKTKKKEMLRKATVKIGLKRINMQEKITVEALLDSKATDLMMSSKFARKQGFKLKKIETSIYIRNVDGTFNKERLIKHTVEVNIYYQGHRKRTEIDVIRGQKWNIILKMLWLVHYNPEINWKTKEVKMTRCPDKCERQ